MNCFMEARPVAERLIFLLGWPANVTSIRSYFDAFIPTSKKSSAVAVKSSEYRQTRISPRNCGRSRTAGRLSLAPCNTRITRRTGKGVLMTSRHLTNCRNLLNHNMNSSVAGTEQPIPNSASGSSLPATRRWTNKVIGLFSAGARGLTTSTLIRRSLANCVGTQQLKARSASSKTVIPWRWTGRSYILDQGHSSQRYYKTIHFIRTIRAIYPFYRHFQNRCVHSFLKVTLELRQWLTRGRSSPRNGSGRHSANGWSAKNPILLYRLLGWIRRVVATTKCQWQSVMTTGSTKLSF